MRLNGSQIYSNQSIRNPIFGESNDSIRRIRTPVNNQNAFTFYETNRPIKKNPGQFNPQQKLSLSKFTPQKRIRRQVNTLVQEKSEKQRQLKSGFYAPPKSNPILYPERNLHRRQKSSSSSTPSLLYQQQNNQQNLLPSQIGKQNRYAIQKNNSKVFGPPPEQVTPICGFKKQVDHRPSSMSSLIAYDYALPYKPQKITSKP